MNAMTLNMTAGVGDNSAGRLDSTLAKMAALGKAEASGLGSRRDAGLFLVGEAFDGKLREDDAEAAYDAYVTAQGKTAASKHLVAGDNPASRKAQVSKFRSFIKLGMLPHVDGRTIMARSVTVIEQVAAAGTKVLSPFDALKAVCTAQCDAADELTDEQIVAVVSKPEPAEKDAMAKLVAAYKAAYKLSADLALPGCDAAMQGYADAITELGGELPPMTKDEKKEAEALAFLAKRGRI
jgi:hypothetical protein